MKPWLSFCNLIKMMLVSHIEKICEVKNEFLVATTYKCLIAKVFLCKLMDDNWADTRTIVSRKSNDAIILDRGVCN